MKNKHGNKTELPIMKIYFHMLDHY